MTVTRIPTEPKKQIHFYIKKNIITQIKNFINNKYQYKNISLLLHSFSTWIFNVDEVYSNLHDSMSHIFSANNISVIKTDASDNNYNASSSFCIRPVGEKIKITEEFRNLWKKEKENNLYLYDDDQFIKLYESKQIQSNSYFKK